MGAPAQGKVGWQKVVVALANKNARILWALFVRGKPFDARHVSVKPGVAGSTSPVMAMVAMPVVGSDLKRGG